MTGSTQRIVHSASRMILFLATVLYTINAIGDSHESSNIDSTELSEIDIDEVTEARWYKIDLVVFAQNTLVEDDPENWPTYPILNQSSPLVDLIYPTDEETSKDDSIEEIENPLSDQIDTDVETKSPLPKSPEELSAFTTLPDELHLLGEYAQKLEQDQRTRVLFHESWNHPIMSDELAIPVRITGGDQFGNLNELSGWINVHVSRYLHIETNLYFTDIIESNNPFDLVTGNSNFNADLENTHQTQKEIRQFGGIRLFSSDEFDINRKPLDPNKEYAYQVAVNSAQMNEKRRLRSKELHYIDNPKFGLLIYFTPIEFAEIESEIKLLQ